MDIKQVGLDQLDPLAREALGRGAFSRSVQHRRVEVDAGDTVARHGQRDGEPAATDGQLEDRAASSVGERAVQVEVARIVLQVEVVQARERARGGGIGRSDQPAAGSQRTVPPAAFRTASALIASSAARFAAIAVVSAWSYGGDTSTTSIPASSTAPTIWRTARRTSRVSIPPGSGVPGAGRQARVDDVDVEAEVDAVGPVERLVDGLGDDRLGAALLDLAHEVVAQALLLHPCEGLDGRPVAAQPDLDEVAAIDCARFDQAAHRGAVAGEDAPVVVGRVGMGVEMDDADAAQGGAPRRPPMRTAR